MALQDLEEFFDPTLKLPIRGKVYTIESPDAATGIRVQRLFTMATSASLGADLSPEDLAALELDDAEEIATFSLVLGAAYEEMKADKIPWEYIKHAGTTAMMWIGLNRQSAELFWSAGVGEAQRPVPRDRKAPAKKAARKSQATRSRSRAGSPDLSSLPVPPDPLATTTP